ncbi:MAG: peptidoglycan-binding domain-containing protein [Patescibacteria group bacterium]
MSILNFLKSFFRKPETRFFGITKEDIKNGASSPNVFSQKEGVASVAVPTFQGVNSDGSVRKFPYQYQDGSSACVAFTMAKITLVLYYILNSRIVKWSAGFWYKQRNNAPYGGMNFDNARYLSSTGAIVEELLPSEGLSETAINALDISDHIKDTADGFAISPNWFEVPLDFDTVASTLEQTKKPIMLWGHFGSGEFFYTSYPKANSTDNPWAHSFTAVDTTIKNGVKYIVIEDSADYEANYVKYISKEWFDLKVFLARYPINFKFQDTPKPVFDGSVKSLQECLIYEKFLANGLNTGYFGSLTKQALIKFQTKYGIVPNVGYFGEITKAKLKELYN